MFQDCCLRKVPIITRALFSICSLRVSARQIPYYSSEGMVVSADPYATSVGFAILRAGGNAADAAAAVGFALAVTYPSAGNLGGGGFLVYREPSGRVHTLNYREKAPLKASADMFVGPEGEARPGLSLNSLLAVGVPGSVDGMLETLERFGSGRLARREILSGAIRLAREGFPINYEMSQGLSKDRERLIQHPFTAALLFPGGKALGAGDTLRQPDLARVLEEISAKGKEGFYSGWVADSLARFMESGGGLITRQDLAGYACAAQEPIVIDYRDFRLYTMGPPSAGGVVLGQILGLLEPFDLQSLGFNSAVYVHHLAEAERLAHADRNYFLGDPDLVKIPVKGLLSASYLAARRALIPADKAGQSSAVRHGFPESDQTTHFCVVDRWGGAASVTTTLNGGFGMGAVVPGAGFFLNNEMDDFNTVPGKPNMFGLVQGPANAVESGKRMLSSMTPTIVTRRGGSGPEELFLTLGASGGPKIPTAVLQVFLNAALFGMNVREAVQAPRFHHQHLPDVLYAESSALSEDTRRILGGMGYTLETVDHLGMACAVARLPDGWLAGWGDGFGMGVGTGY